MCSDRVERSFLTPGGHRHSAVGFHQTSIRELLCWEGFPFAGYFFEGWFHGLMK